MLRHGRLVTEMVIAIAAIALATPSIASAASVAKIKASKHREGPYSGGTITDHMSVGETQSYYFRVVNKRDRRQHLALSTNVPAAPEYERTWFKGSHDITSDVEGGFPGYGFTVGDRAKTFRVEVTKNSNGGSQCVDGHLNKSSQIDVSLVAIDDDTACV